MPITDRRTQEQRIDNHEARLAALEKATPADAEFIAAVKELLQIAYAVDLKNKHSSTEQCYNCQCREIIQSRLGL